MWFHRLYQVFFGISICIICNNDGVYDILYKNMLPSEEELAYSLPCFIDETHDSCLIQLWKIIHQAYVFIQQITITIQWKFSVSFSSSFSTCFFQSMTVCHVRSVAMSHRDATKRVATLTIACTVTCIFRVENVFNV